MWITKGAMMSGKFKRKRSKYFKSLVGIVMSIGIIIWLAVACVTAQVPNYGMDDNNINQVELSEGVRVSEKHYKEIMEEREIYLMQAKEIEQKEQEMFYKSLETQVSYIHDEIREEDDYILAKIAMAEAEGEDTIGKALVIRTVLNRVQSDSFPNTVKDVIYQKNQFAPIRNGRYDRVEPNDDCYKALQMVKEGWDDSKGALYFERTSTKDTWHSSNLIKLFTHGNHTFYK